MPSPKPDALPPVLLRSALLTEGLTADEIQRSRRNGTLQSLARGAYCDASSASSLSKEQLHRLRAHALAIRSPHLVLSHLSAATVLRLPLWRPRLEDVHLTRIGTSGGRTTPGRIVHRAVLAPSEIIVVSGVRVTSVARTLVDLACTESMAFTVMAADAALQRQWVSIPALTEALDATGHRRGAAAARRALRFADGRAESAGESMIRVTMQSLGLPPPTLQIRIYAPDGRFLGRVDLGYPELGVLFEFDGLVKYRKPFHAQDATQVVIEEKIREDRIRDLGYVVVRFVWAELADPAAVLAKVEAGLARGRQVMANRGIAGTWSAEPVLQIED